MLNKHRPTKKSLFPAYMIVCEHFEEACAAPYPIKSDANPACGITQLLSVRCIFERGSKFPDPVKFFQHAVNACGQRLMGNC
jgi:hypothetical protein